MTGSDLRRHIRSFVRRDGRVTRGQQHALDTLWPLYGIEFKGKAIDLNTIFDHSSPYVLEIGFGNGESLAEMASKHPDLNFLGIEVHKPGVGHLLRLLKEDEIGNVRIVSHDAVELLQTALPTAGFQQISVFFPDPWPKKRHHKRRLINPEFAGLALDKLSSDGVLHYATDSDNYAEHIAAVMKAQSRFKVSNIAAALPRPTTKFERRGIAKGHTVHDLVYQKAVR